MIDEKQRILLLVSHPDDETIGAGILMQRQPDARVVFGTSGAPNTLDIWLHFGHPARCAWIREREARAALRLVGRDTATFLRFRDGSLYKSIRKLYDRVAAVINEWKPTLLLTHAYEAGHPDHDVCSFVAACLSQDFGIPVWEMPYYHGDPDTGALIHQRFLGSAKDCQTLIGSEAEIALKRKMFDAHASQQQILADFDPALESFRPQPQYDFSAAPSPGVSSTAIWHLPLETLFLAFNALAPKR